MGDRMNTYTMTEDEKEALIREAEMRVRTEIAKKMEEDRFTPQMIKKYTGIVLQEEIPVTSEYDLAAKQVACDMLLRGLPLETIAVATRLPYPLLRELKSQLPD